MKAIMLAAGEGSRLRPLTADRPKPMIRVANKPIAQHVVEALVAQGIKDITFVVGYQKEKVQSHFQDGRRFGARISYAFQPVLSGTADALLAAPRPAEPFLALGADNLVDGALVKRVLSAPGEGATLAVHASETPGRYGVVTLEGDRVASIEEKPANPRSGWVSTGVYRFAPEDYDRLVSLRAAGALGLPDLVQSLLAQGRPVQAARTDDLWADAVYPWDLLRVQAEVVRRATPDVPVLEHVAVERGVMVGDEVSIGPYTTLGRNTCIGGNVEIGGHSTLENCIVMDDAQIGPYSYLKNTIIGAGAIVGPRFTAVSGPCEPRTADGHHALADFGSVVGQDARVGACVTLSPGTILGNRARVALGKTCTGTIEDGANIL
jgi:glucose-1-phosphate thymidylyltransferase